MRHHKAKILQTRFQRNKLPAKLYKGKKVLDLTGTNAAAFSQLGAKRVYSVTNKRIPLTHPQIQIVVAKQHRLPFPDNYFDFIYCHNVLNQVSDPEAVLEELYRVLKPHGWSWVAIPGNTKITKSIQHIQGKLTPNDIHKLLTIFDLSSQPVEPWVQQLLMQKYTHTFSASQIQEKFVQTGFRKSLRQRRGVRFDYIEQVYHNPNLKAQLGNQGDANIFYMVQK